MRVRTIRQLLVFPNLPKRLSPLAEMAHNLWYSWNWDVVRLFLRLDADAWEKCHQNPVEMLSALPQFRLEKAAHDEGFLASMDKVYARYTDYLNRKKWFHFKHPSHEKQHVAYFSLEYGLDTGLPVYSGGLGVLSGDTLKSASDLGIPMVAVGLLYRYGYFRQSLAPDGWQQERYEENDWYHMPVSLVKGADGSPLKIAIQLDGVPVQIQIWKVMVGLVPLFLLDSNVPENAMKAREITSVLYGGDKDMRIRQEIVLGIGGVKALQALGYQPSIFHCNEGHSWFLTLERVREFMSQGLSFAEASHLVWSTTVFTTHTPVPAGNERFDSVLLSRYLNDLVRQLGITWDEFLAIGKVNVSDDQEQFCMTVAALKYAAFCNGVSELHGTTSRDMWHNIWPELPREEIPIKSITNGVHVASWLSHDMSDLFESYFGPRFIERPGAPELWEKVHKIPDAELWRVHNKRRERLVFFARKLLRAQVIRRGGTPSQVAFAETVLDPHALTIGFARRFSTYKRGNLLFHDLERLTSIVTRADRPVQIIISGKAHPLDNPGKEIIKEIFTHISLSPLAERIVFLEDYDINVARYLVQGADVWLNNPRRPQEASGTSGMKASLNGALNLSILDGWWAEGYNDETGFKIGNGEELDTPAQDNLDADSLYSTLERDVIPLFYLRSEDDLPVKWVAKMKHAIHMAGQRFSAQRMLMDYANQFYVPALRSAIRLSSDQFGQTKQQAAWLSTIDRSWPTLAIKDLTFAELSQAVQVGQKIPVRLRVDLGSLTPKDVRVEVIAGPINAKEEFLAMSAIAAQTNGSASTDGTWEYQTEITCHESGRLGISARIIPHNDQLYHTRKPKLISWW